MQIKERKKILSTIDLIEGGLYKNEKAYDNARDLVEVFSELKAVRNVCADLVNKGPEAGEYATRISPELVVKWLDRTLDVIEKRHEKNIQKYS